MRRCTSALVISVMCLSILVVAAGVSNAGPRDHEDGFFLRLSAGGGMASSSTRVEIPPEGDFTGDVADFEFDGTAVDVNFAIGGIVRPNLALHATLYGWLITDPEMTLGEETGTLDGDLDLTAIGAGVTYYLMPANIYLSPSVGYGSLTAESGGVSVESDYGLVLDFTLGKEWWVSDGWALGIAAGATYHSIPDDSAEENWTGLSYTLRFTATMN